MTKYKLRPCPCCGSRAELRHTSGGDDFVKCTNASCGLRTKNCHENENGAVSIWNRRANDGRD